MEQNYNKEDENEPVSLLSKKKNPEVPKGQWDLFQYERENQTLTLM